MHKTNISWCDFASNPIRSINLDNEKAGWFCTKKSDGCKNCYSETLNTGRFGNGLTYTHSNRQKNKFVLIENEFDSWIKRKKPAKIFVCDMIDLFHEDIPFEMILSVFYRMAQAEQHTFQVLTKRPERALGFFKWWDMDCVGRRLNLTPYYAPPIKNVWFGVSVENQEMAGERIPMLLEIPASVRFLSCEPLLGQVELHKWLAPFSGERAGHRLHWVIAGGESGSQHRPMNLYWARSIRDECNVAGMAFFFKQESASRPGTNPTLDGVEYQEFPKETA